MTGKRRASSSSLSEAQPRDKKRKAPTRSDPKPTDEFQQVTLPGFVDQYRVEEMGYGADVFYQPDVSEIRYSISQIRYVSGGREGERGDLFEALTDTVHKSWIGRRVV